jgi:hypothetical protein
MSDTGLWPWIALVLLGAWHGINPGMGWLFAVALGLQGQERRAVWRALPPLALGHALAVAAALALAGLIGLLVPPAQLKWLVAAILLLFGLCRLMRSRHPRYGGMRVGALDLTVWSFLMASAHGAGLMALPFVLGIAAGPRVSHAAAHASSAQLGHGAHAAGLVSAGPGAALAGALLHTAAYFLVMGLVAVIVYERLGLKLLRRMWFNLDLVWAAALILTALLTPFV